MTRIAALFPGQGSQFVGMGHELAKNFRAAEAVFDRVNEALDFPLSKLCWEGPAEELQMTEKTQPALLTHSIAAWEILKQEGLEVDGFAGHSLGEYSAITAAGGLSLEDAAQTVRLRGRLMQEAVPAGQGAMAAVLGLEDGVVVSICEHISDGKTEVVAAVNFNAPGQVVIAGSTKAVDTAIEKLKEAGARRALPLPVSAPFHSPLMAPAREGLTPTLQSLDFHGLSQPLYRNVDASPVTSPKDLCEGLIRQVDAPVLWSETIRKMIDDGFDTFIEIGAGKVLSGLVKRIHRPETCYQAGSPDEIQTLLENLD